MRIALIGDLQYVSAEQENLAYKMNQIASLKPDFAVVMGDFSGCAEDFERTGELAKLLGCPWHAILGNHDVEYEPGEFDLYDPVGTYRQIYGKDPRCAVIANGVLLICITVEKQPVEMMRTVNAVYVSDEQFEWVENELKAHAGMPTVLIAHAPMAGSGFRSSRPMHSAALDTYLDQTYNEHRWPALLKKYPQIKAWCSAHFHLGHDYDTAITEKDGVVHISCGVMTACSRDGSRHTRILDITDDEKLIISTLDHNSDSGLSFDAAVDLTGTEPPCGKISSVIHGEMLLGNDTPENIWYNEKSDRYYIATANGILWEYQCELNEFVGALALDKKADELCIKDDRLIISYGGKAASVDINSRGRFHCYGGFLEQEITEEEKLFGDALPAVDFTTRTAKEGLYVKFIK